jgi:uncharacterized protein
MMTVYQPTPRTQVHRRSERAVYDRDVVHAIIDEALVCHVGIVVNGEPRVLPTTILRIGEDIYVHGSTNNGVLTALAAGAPACIAVTLTDSIVAGRSGFGCSMDYRSVVVYATAETVADSDKERILEAFVQSIIPGHTVRRPTQSELEATLILRFPLREVSAKVRDCGVVDVESDYELDLWAGVIPLELSAGPARSDGRLKPGIGIPDFAKSYRR